MADRRWYPVYFESPELLPGHERRVKWYFGIHRKSGGGDCGPLRKVSEGVYSISFKDQKDQRAVLQRSRHVVDVGDTSLEFTVREGPAPSSKQTNTTPGGAEGSIWDTTATTESLSDTGPSLPPSSEVHELNLQCYLLHYLKDCPKAGKWLDKQLTLLDCSAELYPEEEKVLVRRRVGPGATDDNWKTEVDPLFETIQNHYICHYELDPQKVRTLLESGSSQTADEVKVYSEVGMAVVVGESSQVNARLNALQDKPSSGTKQSVVWRLGEVKLRLLWKKLQHSLQRDFPEVKVTKGEGGQLILEGSAEEVLKAHEFISEWDRMVVKRTLSDFSPRLLAFLKKVYGSPGMLSDFLGFGVEIEIRETELRLFSFSTANLVETELALQREFKLKQIEVPKFFKAVYSIREKLRPTLREMNRVSCRVEVLVESNSMVYIVGHTREVEELTEVVTLLILDQSREGKHQNDQDATAAQKMSSLDLDKEVVGAVGGCSLNKIGLKENRLLFHDFSSGNTEDTDEAGSLESETGAAAGGSGDGVRVEIIQGTIETQQKMLCQEQESESKVCEKRASATRPNDNRTVSEQQTTQDAETITRRIILLGKTGAGKSSLANTIFGENVFEVYHGTTGTKTCVSKTKNINGRQVKLMDTPGLFDSDPGNIDLSPEILKSIIEFAPVTHAFLLVLKVERFTKHELAVVDEMLKCFSEEALKYTTVVFTHGDNLPKGKKIEEWVSHYEALRNLVQKCGGRCHVFDNRYWKNNSQDQYRNNQNQVQELLKTIDKTVRDNRGPYCTDNLLQIMLSLLERERESRASSSCCML